MDLAMAPAVQAKCVGSPTQALWRQRQKGSARYTTLERPPWEWRRFERGTAVGGRPFYCLCSSTLVLLCGHEGSLAQAAQWAMDRAVLAQPGT